MPNKMSIPYKVKIINNSDNSQTHEYYDTNGNLIKSNTEQKPIHNQQNPINLPEVVVTAENPNKNKNAFTWDNLYNSGAGTIAGFIPGIGDAMEIGQIGYDLSKGNYSNAALGAGLLLIPGNASNIIKRFKPITDDLIYYLKNSRFKIPLDNTKYYRVVTSSAIDDANKVGVIRANPNSIDITGNKVEWAGASFTKGRPYIKPKSTDFVIVSDDPIEMVGKKIHETIDEFNLNDARKLNTSKIGSEVTPIYGELLNNTPSGRFVYWQKGNGPISRYLWTKKRFTKKGPDIEWNAKDWFGLRHGVGYDNDDLISLNKHLNEYRNIVPSGMFDDPRTEVQYLSKDFQRWNNNSKFKGVFYHGTPEGGFDIFDSSAGKYKGIYGGRSTTKNGIYFTPNKQYAHRYRVRHIMKDLTEPKNAHTFSVFLKSENPLDFKNNIDKNINVLEFNRISDNFMNYLNSNNYDGLFNPALNRSKQEYVVFNPNQIKSTVGGNGDFSSKLSIYK